MKRKTPLKSASVYSKHEWPISPLKLHSIKENGRRNEFVVTVE